MQRLLVICGPTAVGKTEVAVQVAQRLGGEVISGDSMQIYRGMEIGTGQPSAEEQEGVPHHLVRVRPPDQPCSAAEFQALADQAIAGIAGRGKLPMLVGGTGLYMRGVTDGLSFTPATADPELRAALAEEAGRLGSAALHQRLAAVDPATAARLHSNDLRRIIRALEVYHLTGRPLSAIQEQDQPDQPRYDLLCFGLTMPRAALYRRIEQRIDAMLAAGWLDEARRLLDQGYAPSLPALQALGYPELFAHLHGELDYTTAVALIKRNTRRYAKRQLTWFRRDRRIVWIDLGEARDIPAAVATIVARVEGIWGWA